MQDSSTPSQVIALHRIDIPSPCTASWEAMQGNDAVRHCGLCKKNVFNLSAMPEAEALALVAGNTDGSLCVRFYRRSDGTVMTSDCGAGHAATPRTRRMLAGVAAGAGAAVLAMAAHAGPAAGQQAGNPAAQDRNPMIMGAPMAMPQQVEVRGQRASLTSAPTMGKPSSYEPARQAQPSEAEQGNIAEAKAEQEGRR